MRRMINRKMMRIMEKTKKMMTSKAKKKMEAMATRMQIMVKPQLKEVLTKRPGRSGICWMKTMVLSPIALGWK